MSRRRRILLTLFAAILACAACGPEDGRPRGGGSGGDSGNKPAIVMPKSKVFTSSQ